MNANEFTLDLLGTVARGRSRHRPRDAVFLYGGPYPFVQTGDVKRAGLYLRDYDQTYSEAGLAQSKLWPVGTLCITIAANIAETSILGIEACFPDSIIGFSADPEKADVRFIKYLFDAVLKMRYQSFTQGATQDNLSQSKLLSIRFSVPDLEDQKNLADFLSGYDDLIENNRWRMALLERSARELYREWFVRLRFPGYEETKTVDGVPKGWTRKTAIEVANVMSGGTPKTAEPNNWGGCIPFFTPKDATDHVYAYETERTLTEEGLNNCNSKLYPKNTIFLGARGSVGKINLAQTDMAMNQTCYALLAKNGLTQVFLYFALVETVAQLKARAVGSVFDAIVIDTFRRLPFIEPSESLIAGFSEFATPLLEQIDRLATQNRNLTTARDLLLPRLMSGESTVRQLQ